MLRSYGFVDGELLPAGGGNPSLNIDPKLVWALANREHFAMDLNRADASTIARVSGIGLRNPRRIVELRRLRRIRYVDVTRLRCSMKKIEPFIVTADYSPVSAAASSEVLRRSLTEAPQQMNLWPKSRAA